MSFLDKVTKAVGDVVDKGKKDVDQFVRIQKINAEIRGIERKIADLQNQIDQAKQVAGETAIDLLRSGALVSPQLQPFVEQVRGFEDQIAAERAGIAGKESDIARIKAEHAADHVAAEPGAASVPATPTAAPPDSSAPAAAPVVPPPIPDAARKVCAQCGATLTGGPFCPECGARQTS